MQLFHRIGLLFLAVVTAGCLWWWLRPSQMVSDASTLIEAMKSGDGEQLLRFAASQETDCSGLTADKIHQAWKVLIEPHLAKSKLVRSDPIEATPNQTQAIATYRYVTDKGDTWALNAIANRSESGPRAIILAAMIDTYSIFDESGHANTNLTTELAYKAVLRVRPKLEALGIHKIALGPSRCVTWDELEEMHKYALAHP